MNNKLKIHKKQMLSNFEKAIRIIFEECIGPLFREGVIFFGVKIPLCNYKEDGTKENMFCDEAGLKEIFDSIGLNSKLSNLGDFVFGGLEFKEGDTPILNCVFGFRTLFDSINSTEFILKEMLWSVYSDYKINYLVELKDVIKFLCYISKDFNKNRPYRCGFVSLINTAFHRYEYYMLYHRIYCLIEHQATLLYFLAREDVNQYLTFIGVSHIFQKKPSFEATYYLTTHLIQADFIVINNKFYVRMEKNLVSFKYVGNDSYIIKNFSLFMLKSFYDFIDLRRLCLLFSEHAPKVIEETKILLGFSRKTLILNLLEFNDGLYFGDYDLLLPKCKIVPKPGRFLMDLCKHYQTLNFYDCSYRHVTKKNMAPIFWKENFFFNFTEEEFKILCLLFRNILFTTEESTRQSVLLGYTFESPLIIDIVIKIWGVENLTSLPHDPKILFRNIDFMKNLSENPIHEKAYYLNLTRQILGSYVCHSVDLVLKDAAMQSKIWRFIFNNNYVLCQEKSNKLLEEIPKILVYCNKIHFELTGTKLSKKKKEAIEKSILSPLESLTFFEDFTPAERYDPSFRP